MEGGMATAGDAMAMMATAATVMEGGTATLMARQQHDSDGGNGWRGSDMTATEGAT
jgi:hypothetical protein